MRNQKEKDDEDARTVVETGDEKAGAGNAHGTRRGCMGILGGPRVGCTPCHVDGESGRSRGKAQDNELLGVPRHNADVVSVLTEEALSDELLCLKHDKYCVRCALRKTCDDNRNEERNRV